MDNVKNPRFTGFWNTNGIVLLETIHIPTEEQRKGVKELLDWDWISMEEYNKLNKAL